jgi:CRP-like cAMP-binding protein
MRALEDGFRGHSQLGALQDLASLGRRREFSPDQALFSQGAAASHAALIVRGLVKVMTAGGADGGGTFLAIRGPGELLGEEAALRGSASPVRGRDPRLTVATALTPVTAQVFPVAQLRRFLYGHPPAVITVAQNLSDRLEEAEARIASAARDNADRRLARLLCDLGRYGEAGETGPGIEIPVKLSQAELASWIGTCRETVDRALRRWRDRGIIATRYRTVVINDRQALARIAGVRIAPRRPPKVAAVPG